MPIPDYQTCMLHLFRLALDGAQHTLRNAVPALADIFRLTDAERTELLPSGQTAIFQNRVAWANLITVTFRLAVDVLIILLERTPPALLVGAHFLPNFLRLEINN